MLQLIVAGVSVGLLYCLIGLGFQLMARAARVFNFAHGQVVTIGALIYCSLASISSAPGFLLLAVVLTGIAGAALSLFINEVVLRPARRLDELGIAIVTVALSIILGALATKVWGDDIRSAKTPWPFGDIRIDSLDVVISGGQIAVVIAGCLLVAAVYLFFDKAPAGRDMLAVAENRDGARLSGISVRRVELLVFGGAGLFAGLAGALITPISFASAGGGFQFTLNAFAVVMIGGMEKPAAPLVGGLVLGLLQVFVARYGPSQLSTVIVLAIVIAIIIIRPEGLLGHRNLRIA